MNKTCPHNDLGVRKVSIFFLALLWNFNYHFSLCLKRSNFYVWVLEFFNRINRVLEIGEGVKLVLKKITLVSLAIQYDWQLIVSDVADAVLKPVIPLSLSF